MLKIIKVIKKKTEKFPSMPPHSLGIEGNFSVFFNLQIQDRSFHRNLGDAKK